MKKHKLSLQFEPPKAGFIRITVFSHAEPYSFEASSIFNPFEGFLDWLESLAKKQLPCTWRINEEGPQTEFEVLRDELGQAHLLVRGTLRDDCENYDEMLTFVDAIVNPEELARIFYHSFRDYVDTEFTSSGWGENDKTILWRRVRGLD